MKTHIYFVLFTILLSPKMAQITQAQKAGIKKTDSGTEIYTFPQKVSLDVLLADIHGYLDMPKSSKLVYEWKGKSKFSAAHRKFRQWHQEREVYGQSLILHGSSNAIDHVTGLVARNFAPEPEALLSIKNAQEIMTILLQERLDNILDEESYLFSESMRLVYVDQRFPEHSGQYVLAWIGNVSTQDGSVSREFIIHAGTGSLIFEQDLVCSMHGEGKAPSYHYGEVAISTDSVAANKYLLRDKTRGKGNTTFSDRNGTNVILEDDDNIWVKPEHRLGEVAYDAHFATASFYDFLVENFDYSGIDGDGKSMNAVVNVNKGADYVNAYWNNVNAYFGNGNCHYHPLTTYSIVGHEFAHGITRDNSNLIYSGESGALNESFSDIIGKSLQYFREPENFEWTVAHELLATRFAKPFRSMAQPNLFSNPKQYKGLHWRDGGGVHSNSGVLNHWFYLMVNGGSGKNELDSAYQVEPVDILKVLDLVFLCQTSYLQSNSTYTDMFEYSKLSCASLYGENSTIYNSMIQAWLAVGFPYKPIEIADYDDLAISAKVRELANSWYTCYQNEYPEINLTISNKGTITYFPGQEWTISFTHNNIKTDRIVVLADTLAPDSSQLFTFTDYLLLESTANNTLNIFLNHVDDLPSNNRFYLYFENFATPGTDLVISAVTYKDVVCFSNEIAFEVRVRNASCFNVPKETPFVFRAFNKNKELVAENTYKFTQLLGPRMTQAVNITLPYMAGENTYTFEISSAVDSLVNNNTREYSFTEKGELKEPEIFTFTDDLFTEKFKHTSSHPKFTFENENYFRSKTAFNTSTAPCLELQDNFKSISGGVAQFTVAETCLDVSKLISPEIFFDMRQFRSSHYQAFPEIEGNSVIFRLELESPEINEFKYFKNLTDKDLYQYIYPLPEKFKGKLKLIAFTSRHDGTSNINGNNDVILLDNIELRGELSSQENNDHSEIRLSPNPAISTVQVLSGKEPIQQIKLLDYSGKLWQSHVCGNVFQYAVSLDNLPAGMYLVSITTESGVYTKKLIRI